MLKIPEGISTDSSCFSGSAGAIVDRLACKQWYALYTRSRHEKTVERELNKRRIETFLPLRKLKRHWSDRVKVIEEPLFQSYIFVRMPLQEKFTVLNTFGAVSFVHFGANLPAALPEKDIESLRRFAEKDLPLDPFPYIKEGQRVYIRSGPFKGIEGFVVRKNNQCRLVISLDMLMQSVSVEVDQACIEIA